jgi:hypothetical protein
MLFGMALCRFIRMMRRQVLVPLRYMRMMSGLFVRAGLVLPGRLAMMFSRFVVMLGGLFMVLNTFMSRSYTDLLMSDIKITIPCF